MAIQQQFEQLKQQLNAVDAKYSTVPQKVVLDLPPTLALQPKEYTPPTEQEMQQEAQLKTLADYLSKKYNIELKADNQQIDISRDIDKTTEITNRNMAKLEATRDKKAEDSMDNAIANGIGRSSIAEVGVKKIIMGYDDEISAERESGNMALQQLQEDLTKLSKDTAEALANLDEERDAKTRVHLTSILDSVNRQLDSVLQYNNNINEREVKYQASIAEKQARHEDRELERAASMAKLKATIGVSGVEELIINDKLSTVKDLLSQLPRSEAVALVKKDGYLEAVLGKYYSYILDYANRLPL